MTQKTPIKEAPKKEPKQLVSKTESTAAKKPEPEKTALQPEEAKSEGTPKPVEAQPKPAKPKLMTQADMQVVIEALSKTVVEHTRQISELQEALARKRKPVASNGKVQIKDKVTGKVYPSKNNAYQSLLKSGELKDLVDAGVFGPNPAKNTFGWYALVRALPDRFEEIKAEEKIIDGK